MSGEWRARKMKKKRGLPQWHRDTEIGESNEPEKKELTQSSLRLDTEGTEKRKAEERTAGNGCPTGSR
jgi:hypothetical protein